MNEMYGYVDFPEWLLIFLNKYDLQLFWLGFFAAAPVSIRLTFSDRFALYVAFNRISLLFHELFYMLYFNNSWFKSFCACYPGKFMKRIWLTAVSRQ